MTTDIMMTTNTKRIVNNYIEAGVCARLTDEMIDRANILIELNDEFLCGREIVERTVHFNEHNLNRFEIHTETKHDIRSYKFSFDDKGNITYLGMEGDFKGL